MSLLTLDVWFLNLCLASGFRVFCHALRTLRFLVSSRWILARYACLIWLFVEGGCVFGHGVLDYGGEALVHFVEFSCDVDGWVRICDGSMQVDGKFCPVSNSPLLLWWVGRGFAAEC